MEVKVTELCELYKLSQREVMERIIGEAVSLGLPFKTDKKTFVCVNPDNPVVLSAHMDVVMRLTPKKIYRYRSIIFADTILGGDDRNGIYIALRLMRLFKRGHYCYCFFTDEEAGCIGSREFVTKKRNVNWLKKKNCFIGLDRRGHREVALYGYDNEDLTYLFEQRFYETEIGSVTDVKILSSVSDIACVNLSVGFYHEHTDGEYTDTEALEYTAEILTERELIESLSDQRFKVISPTPPYVFVDSSYESYESYEKIYMCDSCGVYIYENDAHVWGEMTLCGDCYRLFKE